jgi:putative nucleotidyltransferase with HDIG domain
MPGAPARRLEAVRHSRVGLRVSVLFIGCAIVPLIGLGVLTLARTTRQLDEQARTRLHYDVKAVAMTGIERLRILEDHLSAIDPLRTHAATDRGGDRAERAFSSFVILDGEGREIGRAGTRSAPRLPEAEAAHLRDTGVLLLRQATPRGVEHWLAVRAISGGSEITALAPVDHAYLWSLGEAHLLPPDAELCVFDASAPIACSPGVSPGLAAVATSIPPNVQRSIEHDGAVYHLRTWAVPLRGRYGSAPWVLAMMRPQEVVRAPLAQFARDFWTALAAALVLVTLVAISQVRRTLQPLTRLMEGTRRLARRDFAFQVNVQSGDEFQDLAASFNALSSELREQFARLEAFNLGALAALARTVDAKSPWTAGHSERVAALAVEIGRELSLPEDEISALQRGGLVHDIGKLATPGAILDKPGPLTDAERRVMFEHPERGARILEPIVEFAPLLPIVLEHHERWDGTGYPRGLAGEQIARTARVLAVADAFDAIQSDRPYRHGMSVPDAVRLIAANAGKHFDPIVAAAFCRLMERRGYALGSSEPTRHERIA